MESHYLTALSIWTAHMGRPPMIHELAAYCNKTRSPVYGALVSLEHKGYVLRNDARQFEVVR